MQAFSNRLRILYVGTLPPHPGGSAIVAAQLLRGLAGRGHQVRALAPITPKALADGDAFAAGLPGISVTRFLVPYFESARDESGPDEYWQIERRRIFERLPALVSSERPDVLVIGRESFARHLPDFAISHGLPSLLIVHGGRTFARLEGGNGDPIAASLLNQFQKAHRIVAVATHLGMRMVRLGLSEVEVIPNPVDLDRFRPLPIGGALRRTLRIHDESVVVVHASKLSSVKRPLDLVESGRLALGRNPNLLYVIVGDGPLKNRMREACDRSEISDRFRFVGWVDHSRMPEYLNQADLVILPSESEGQALVCLESQACGKVVLASKISGADEIVQDGESGMLFEKGDIEALTEKTLYAAGKPEFRRQIGLRARKAAELHALDEIVCKYEARLCNLAFGLRRPSFVK